MSVQMWTEPLSVAYSKWFTSIAQIAKGFEMQFSIVFKTQIYQISIWAICAQNWMYCVFSVMLAIQISQLQVHMCVKLVKREDGWMACFTCFALWTYTPIGSKKELLVLLA